MHLIAAITDPEVLDVPDAGQMPGTVVIGLIVFGLFFVFVVMLMVVSATKRYRAAKDAGLDPFAGDIQLMGAAKDSQLLAPERSVEERLAEVDGLLAAGTISQDEHDAARARIISSL